MVVKRKNKQLVITISDSVDKYGAQRLLDYANYLEISAKSKARQRDADALAELVNIAWWKRNSKRFVK